ncbi:MAG: hypothetical protein IMZ53_10095 [Thermoplasmata archaeon]|nr:hypothetical protein [Thermoplasmata archaeon]
MEKTKQDELMKKFMSRIPKTMQAVFKKAYSGKSKAAGVRAKCLDCVNLIRAEVGLCEAITCPLWQYRPFQKGQESGKTPKNSVLEKEQGKSDE